MGINMSPESEQNKPKSKAVFIIGSQEMREKERGARADGEKKLGRKRIRMKEDSQRKFPIDVPQFSKRVPIKQFQYLTKALSAPHHKMDP